MKKLPFALSLLLLAAAPAFAVLPVGAKAPDFTLPAALAGDSTSFSLAEALKKGPAVVVFYPKSNGPVCAREAQLFAAAAPQFAEAGASLVVISHDELATQLEVSKKDADNAFPVAADVTGEVIAAYDVRKMAVGPLKADRVSFVIAPDGEILLVQRGDDVSAHVEKTLAAVKEWRAAQLER